MCLTKVVSPNPRLAREAVTCYKVLCFSNKNIEPRFHLYYEPQIKKEISQGRVCSYLGEVNEGFHSYRDLSDAILARGLYTIGRKVVEFTIPAGAIYFEGLQPGGFPGFVSNAIVPGDLIDLYPTPPPVTPTPPAPPTSKPARVVSVTTRQILSERARNQARTSDGKFA